MQLPSYLRRRLRRFSRKALLGVPVLVLFLLWGMYLLLNAKTVSANKPYILTIDGAEYTMHCSEKTVGECLRKDSILVMEQDFLSQEMTDNLEAGMHVIVRKAVPIHIINFVGESQKIFSHGTKVRDVVGELGIVLKENERITPDLDSWIEPDMEVHLLAEREEKFTREVDIPFSTREIKDEELAYGERIVEKKGVKGKKQEMYRLIYSGDDLKEKTLLKSVTLSEPEEEVIRKGIKMPDKTEFIEDGKASFYSDYFEGGRTASGETFHQNDMVAAHKTLPFGTLVKVTNTNNGRSVVVRITDRGPYISGRVIDLTTDAFREIGSLGSGVVPVSLSRVLD